MSKASKALSKQRNMSAKRARKAANRAKYQELAKSGQNSKSKRALATGRNKKVNVFGHSITPCGNIGCLRCNPRTIVLGIH